MAERLWIHQYCFWRAGISTSFFQGIRIIQYNTPFLLLKYNYVQATCFSSEEPSSGLYRRTDPNLVLYKWDPKSLRCWSIVMLKLPMYIRLHVSSRWSHHQASTVEQIQIWFCTIGIPRVYSAEVYCLRCTVKLKLLGLKWIVYCNKLKKCIFTMILKCQV
jgi:hypothetical protein